MLDRLISVNELRKEIDRNFDMQNLYLPVHILDVAEDMDEGIVRCKDCKHRYFADNRIPSEQGNVCGRNGIDVTPDWFCADGVKKDADN